MTVEFSINPGKGRWRPQILRLRSVLERPEEALKKIGAILAAQAQRAFRDEAFGGYKWPARYPNQKAPKVNIAGLVRDLKEGSKPKPRRFQDRPVLRDTGTLFRSLAASSSVRTFPEEASVTVGVFGPAREYAGIHQFGGYSEIAIDKTVRDGLARFLRTAKGKEYRPKLGFLFQVNTLRTKINQRPFIGLTVDSIHAIKRIVEGSIPSTNAAQE